jgi:type I restriction enzyme M protein
VTQTPFTRPPRSAHRSPNDNCSADQNPIKPTDLEDFVTYNAKNRHERKERKRFKSFTYEDLLKRDKLNLDILAQRRLPRRQRRTNQTSEIRRIEDLQAALAQFAEIAFDLKRS